MAEHVNLKDLRGKEVKFYPYRTSSVLDRFLTLDRSHCNGLEVALSQAAGVRADNHTAYEVKDKFEKSVTYVQFHDQYVFFGHRIEEGRW